MCFHSEQIATAQTLSKRFKVKLLNDPNIVSNHIISFTFQKTPVVINKNPDTLQMFHWGLIPFWSKDKEIQKYTLNAKIETLKEKPSFRDCINNRCWIISTGFMEWQWLDPKGKNKQPYLITLPDHQPFAFAGLWNSWVDKQTGEVVDTYTMITTEANELMSEIHNIKKRMPIILTPENELDWLNGRAIEDFKVCDIALKAEAIKL